MLIIVPPSETKRPPPAHGTTVDIASMSFRHLGPTRTRVLDALVVTCSGADAFKRLFVGPSQAADIARNTRLKESPTRPAYEVYTGPLHSGLDFASLSPTAAARAEDSVVIVSALWGAIRPTDRIPPYRLHVCSHLVGLPRLEPTWRAVLPDVLADAAGKDGLAIDLRSPSYQAMGMPAGLGDRTVILRVDLGTSGHRVGDFVAKRIRGEAARHLLESGAESLEPRDAADILADRWPVRLGSPERPGTPWKLTLSTSG